MNVRDEDPARWRESSADPRALTARAADLVDAVRDVPPLPPETLARIKSGVVARRGARRAPLVLRLALMTGFVLASVATARGTMVLWHHFVAPPAPTVTPAARRVASKVLARPAVVDHPVIEELEVVAPPPAEAPSVARARKSVAAPRALERTDVDTTPPEAPSTTRDEAQLLARAISRLRQARDPRGALALLDQYQRSFPHGVMEPEALSARLEAVIQMDDRKTALGLLDGRRAFAGRLGSELLLTRAELRASAGRYADAVADFDELLGPSAAALPVDLAGRSLYGRAICLGHLGRDARARADLAAYARRFPDGKFAGEVARLLKDAGPENRP